MNRPRSKSRSQRKPRRRTHQHAEPRASGATPTPRAVLRLLGDHAPLKFEHAVGLVRSRFGLSIHAARDKIGEMVELGKLLLNRRTLTLPPSRGRAPVHSVHVPDLTPHEQDLAVVIERCKLRSVFGPKVVAEAEQVAAASLTTEGRRNLVDLQTITIDGEDAKDLDDAISLKRRGLGWRLWVHIADVSHYVPWDSQLDREARKRGTSVYLPGHVIPMLPHDLSNGICSLNAGVDRYAFTVVVDINRRGLVTHTDAMPTLIRVDKRYSYNQVQEVLDDRAVARDGQHKPYAGLIKEMAKLVRVLLKRREERGAIDLDLPELSFEMDDQGVPKRVFHRERKFAHKMIEECMLVANVAVAEMLASSGAGIYRIHEPPSEEKATAANEVLSVYGLRLPHDREVIPKDFQAILNQLDGKPHKQAVQMMLLRSMSQAVYSSAKKGHFGLAYSTYTHFTSPIRRYPDLMVHRLLKMRKGILAPGTMPRQAKALQELAETCSTQERTAVDAERLSVKQKGARFLANHIGASFPAVVTGMTEGILFVAIEPFGLEGGCAFKDQPFRFNYDAERRVVTVPQRGLTYELGTPLHVTLLEVNLRSYHVDFLIAMDKDEAHAPARKT